jgi:hypothetical protein
MTANARMNKTTFAGLILATDRAITETKVKQMMRRLDAFLSCLYAALTELTNNARRRGRNA